MELDQEDRLDLQLSGTDGGAPTSEAVPAGIVPAICRGLGYGFRTGR